MKKSLLVTAGSAVLTLAVGFGIKKGIRKIAEKRAQREENTGYYEEIINFEEV